MEVFLPPAELTSHQPPALLIARLCSASADGSSGSSELLPGNYDLLQCCEAAAQTVAVLMAEVGRRASSQQAATPAQGMLISVKNARLYQPILESSGHRMHVERIGAMPPLAMYQASYRNADDDIVMEVALQIMSTNDSKEKSQRERTTP